MPERLSKEVDQCLEFGFELDELGVSWIRDECLVDLFDYNSMLRSCQCVVALHLLWTS